MPEPALPHGREPTGSRNGLGERGNEAYRTPVGNSPAGRSCLFRGEVASYILGTRRPSDSSELLRTEANVGPSPSASPGKPNCPHDLESPRGGTATSPRLRWRVDRVGRQSMMSGWFCIPRRRRGSSGSARRRGPRSTHYGRADQKLGNRTDRNQQGLTAFVEARGRGWVRLHEHQCAHASPPGKARSIPFCGKTGARETDIKE
jgi:hypothetical protein